MHNPSSRTIRDRPPEPPPPRQTVARIILTLSVVSILGWCVWHFGNLRVPEGEPASVPETDLASASPAIETEHFEKQPATKPATVVSTLPNRPSNADRSRGEEFSGQVKASAVSATVRIVADSSYGSGVIVAVEGPLVYILTANHVVQHSSRLEVHFPSRGAEPKRAKVFRAVQVLASNSDDDLAVVRIAVGQEAPAPIPICPPASVPVGGGFAALSVGCNRDDSPTAQIGIVEPKRLVQRQSDEKAVWTWPVDEAAEKGRSGGPLIDRRGLLIGIASGMNDGTSFYSHIDAIHRFLKASGLKWLYSENAK